MTFWVAGAVVGSSLIGASAAKGAASTQAAAADRAAELQNEQFQQTRQDQMPWMRAGEQALNKLIPLTDYQKFGMAQFQQDPGYAFRLSEGQKGLERTAAARGGLISGAALKAAGRYGQEMASQEFGNAYNRFRDTQSLRRNALAGVAGYGPTAASSINAAGQTYAAGAGNTMMNQGETSANALLAGQQARSSSYGQLGSALSKYLSPTYKYGAFGGGSGSFGEGEY